MLRPTISRAPASEAARMSVPWGVVVQPLCAATAKGRNRLAFVEVAEDQPLARCSSCRAYLSSEDRLNAGLEATDWHFTCFLCGSASELPQRYVRRSRRQATLPELAHPFVEYTLSREPVMAIRQAQCSVLNTPLYLFCVDLSSSAAALAAVQAAIRAYLEELPPCVQCALVVFSEDSVGLFDLAADDPVVKWAPASPEAGAAGAGPTPGATAQQGAPAGGAAQPLLFDAVPVSRAAVPVSTHRRQLEACVAALPDCAAAAQGDEEDSAGPPKNCFGDAIRQICRSFQALRASGISCPVRVSAFLSRLPGASWGALKPRWQGSGANAAPRPRQSDPGGDAAALEPSDDVALFVEDGPSIAISEDKADELFSPQSALYRDLGGEANEAGVCIDLYALGDAYKDLASIKFLSTFTGGNLRHYASQRLGLLARDVQRFAANGHAFNCTGKLRCSPEMTVAQLYGHFAVEVAAGEQLLACAGWDPGKAFAAGLAFSNGSSIGASADLFSDAGTSRYPAVQMAFSFLVLAKTDLGGYAMERRMRIQSLTMGMAARQLEVLEAVDEIATTALLSQQIMHVALDETLREARSVLCDWLLILLRHYNAALKLHEADLQFTHHSHLQVVQQVVYGLQHSAVLNSGACHPDERTALQCWIGCLEPERLRCQLYPRLDLYASLYTNPSEQPLALAEASLHREEDAKPAVFLLDVGTELFVCYSDAAAAGLPVPPPADSLLAQRLDAIVTRRNMESAVEVLSGSAATLHSPVRRHLLNDAFPPGAFEQDAEPDSAPVCWATWVEDLRARFEAPLE